MVKPELLEILRCPVCVHDKEACLISQGKLAGCKDCGRKYPIVKTFRNAD